MTTTYTIRVRERLSDHWQGYFAGLELESVPYGGCEISELSGDLDEAALQATLTKLSDLNLHLLSIKASDKEDTADTS